MKCPECGSTKTSILHLLTSENNEVYRKRGCAECGNIFFTVEFDIEETPDFMKEWNKLQAADVTRDIQQITKHFGYRCERHSNRFIYVVYDIKEAILENGSVDASKAKEYFESVILAKNECRFLEKHIYGNK